MLILSSVPNFFQSARQKRRVNFGSLSEMMFFCIPWCFTTLSKYNQPTSCAVAVSRVGTKCAIAVSRVGTKCAILLTLSTTTMMESNPLDSRRWVIKSIETLSQHLVGMGNGLNILLHVIPQVWPIIILHQLCQSWFHATMPRHRTIVALLQKCQP